MRILCLPQPLRHSAQRVWIGRLLLLCGLLLTGSAQAASLRCDKAILHEGAHMYEVSELCGEPVAEFRRIEYLHPEVVVYVDEWVYRLGDNKFQRMLRFENGRLESIRTLRKPQARPYSGSGATGAEYDNRATSGASEYRISY